MALVYDVIIVGGGPAGLSAASCLVRQGHKTVLFDSGKYRNALTKHMHTIPGWDHQDPAVFRAKAREELERYGSVTVEDVEVETLQEECGAKRKTPSGHSRPSANRRRKGHIPIPRNLPSRVTAAYCLHRCKGAITNLSQVADVQVD